MNETERRCRDCPARTVAVCQHVFGKYWHDKSGGDEGCRHPLDKVAEAWYARGWTPGQVGKAITLPFPKRPSAPVAKMPRRAKMPVRPARQGVLL